MCFLVPAGHVSLSSAMVDLIGADDLQGHVQLLGDHVSKAAAASQSCASDIQRLPTHVAETAVTPSKPAVLRGHTLGSPASPVMSSGKKQKQADIRGFLSPKATHV